jgi:hypothetical protein
LLVPSKVQKGLFLFMALRNIDTNFFRSPKVRGLKASLKTLYLFIVCDCSGAGIWIKDLEVASMYTGNKITEPEFKEFTKSVDCIDLGNGKLFFPGFIEHQYPKGLSPTNPALKNFIVELQKYNLLDSEYQIIKTLKRPSKGSLVTVTVTESVIVPEIVVEEEIETEILKTDFEIAFDEYLEMRKKIKKPATERAKELVMAELNKLAPDDEELKIQILNQSILNNWQDVYPIKNKNKANGTGQNSTITKQIKLGGIDIDKVESYLSRPREGRHIDPKTGEVSYPNRDPL